MLFTITLPSRIQLSASLREQSPARAIRFEIRSDCVILSSLNEVLNGVITRGVEHKKEGKNSLKKTRYCFFHLVLSLPMYELQRSHEISVAIRRKSIPNW